ncbi:poly(R)-hydroxyalkanoic acid synthase subunit PhaE [Bacillus sp. REN10]|uniref:poly(R)-hydroxyalkanoic acid synthase subunit PhaE n=1 Tax=Bacillus sp. REN10 TaxID=2782541 RepID=UPI00193C19F2|nr:poly(R)-hydroxyalkanoic acid synthase subunit PhaE [Bacillus sp. REN10]
MTQQTLPDPFAVWKSFYEKTEASWNDVLHETMQQEAYAEWMGQTQSAYLQLQDLIQKTADAYLKQMNMPTREEISSVASLIINLEEKVENLDQKVEDEILNSPALNEINKLKTTVVRLDKKMDRILKALQQVEEAATAPEPSQQASASNEAPSKSASSASQQKK